MYPKIKVISYKCHVKIWVIYTTKTFIKFNKFLLFMATILCVDDDKNYLRLIKRDLVETGYNVVDVQNGRDAIAKVREGSIDLVVLDCEMPFMDDIETMARIIAINNQMPVILNSEHTGYQNNYLAWAASAYVVKSSDSAQLKRVIKLVLDRRQST